MPRRPLPKVEGAAIERGVVPGAARAVPPAAFQPATMVTPAEASPSAPAPPAAVARLPEPHEPLSDGAKLNDRERTELSACESALENLRRAFWDAGQALEVIRTGRHYKETHTSFEAYVEEKWGMRRAQADRLIRAWRLGRRLDPIGSSFGAKIVESQVRPLLPVAGRHGEDAAALVYQAAAEVRGGKVTAGDLEDAAGAIPAEWDPDAAVEAVRARLEGATAPGSGEPSQARTDGVSGAQAFVNAVGQAWGRLQQAVREDVLRAAAEQNPGYVRKVVTDLRGLADELEKVVQ